MQISTLFGDVTPGTYPSECAWLFVTGLLYALMAVIALVGIMPAAFVADKLGRKWTIVPSCFGLAGALLLMAVTGKSPCRCSCCSVSVGSPDTGHRAACV